MDPQVFVNLFNSLITASTAQAGALVADGTDLTWKIVGIMIAWYLLQAILSENMAETFASIMNLMFKAAFILYLLGSWNNGYVSDFFTATMDSYAQTASGGSANASAGVQGIVGTINAIMGPTTTNPICTSLPGGSTSCLDTNGGIGTFLKMIGGGLPGGLAMWVLSVIVKFLACGLLVLLAAVYMLIVNMGAILVGVGLTLGAILVPFMLLPPAEFLFDGWLRFMITAGLMKVVGAVLMTIVNTAIVAASGFVNTTLGNMSGTAGVASATTIDTFALLVVCVITCIGIFLMWQVPGIAGGLVSGKGGAHATNFGKGVVGKNITSRLGIR
jgi:type IV secretory pathway VirB6-like protein